MRGWLKAARENKGYTMKQVAEKLGISESYYSLIESGERQKRMDMMLATGLSSALGVSVSKIVAFESMPEETK